MLKLASKIFAEILNFVDYYQTYLKKVRRFNSTAYLELEYENLLQYSISNNNFLFDKIISFIY